MNTDIICRWRDAITDPPPGAWEGSVKRKDGRIVAASYWERHGSWRFRDADVQPGDQWLDVTDEPTVPRAAVQAAMDEIHARAHYWMGEYRREASFHEVGDQYSEIARGLKIAMDIMDKHFGGR